MGRGVSILYRIRSPKKESIRTISVIQICPSTQISSAGDYGRKQTKFAGDTPLVRVLIPKHRLVIEQQRRQTYSLPLLMRLDADQGP